MDNNSNNPNPSDIVIRLAELNEVTQLFLRSVNDIEFADEQESVESCIQTAEVTDLAVIDAESVIIDGIDEICRDQDDSNFYGMDGYDCHEWEPQSGAQEPSEEARLQIAIYAIRMMRYCQRLARVALKVTPATKRSDYIVIAPFGDE